MVKKLNTYSDLTGALLTDSTHIEVERPGYNIVLPDGSITNRAVLDVEPNHDAELIQKLKYVKSANPAVHP
jgi:hypothetical protein